MIYTISFTNTKVDVNWTKRFTFAKAIELPYIGVFIKANGEGVTIEATITLNGYRTYTIQTEKLD